MLSEINQSEEAKNHMISLMWEIKLRLVHTNSSVVVAKGQEWWVKRGLMHGDRRRFDFGWWAHGSCNIETHT